MAKEFKDYDKKFAKYKGQHGLSEMHLKNAACVHSWPYSVGYWDKAQIKDAVYDSETAEEWQYFRVTQKGLSTQVKLYRLELRLIKHWGLEDRERQRERCRIDNYIGALVRGGQLDQQLKIQR